MKTFNFAGLLMAALTAIMILASCSDSKTSTGVSLERHHRAEGLEGLNNTVRLLTATAPAPQCGNLILEDGEQCDTSESSTCLSCNLVLAKGAPVATDYCGNAVTELPEQCDDGNDGNEDSCTQYCQRAVCGDGYVQPSNGEVCDDKANGNNNDLCTDSCQIPTSERAATIDCAGSLCFVPVSPSQNTVNSAASAGSTGSDYQVEQKGDDTGDDSITGWVRKISSHGDAEECMFADSARDPAKYSQCSVEDDFPRCSNTTKHYDCDAKTFRVVDWTGGEGWPISLEDATCWGPGPCEDGTCTTGEHKGSICDDNGGQVDTPYCETAGNICNVCETARVSLTPGSRPYADCLNDQDHYWEVVDSGGWAETGGCRGCWVSFDGGGGEDMSTLLEEADPAPVGCHSDRAEMCTTKDACTAVGGRWWDMCSDQSCCYDANGELRGGSCGCM